MKKLTPQAVKLIRNSQSLFGEIAEHLSISIYTLRDLLQENTDDRLIGEGVLEIIKTHLSEMQDMELVLNLQVAA